MIIDLGIIILQIVSIIVAWRILSRKRGSLPVLAVLAISGAAVLAVLVRIGHWLSCLTILLPTGLICGVALVWLSHHLLPLHKDQDWRQTLECLITFALGANRPYYVIESGELVERVSGNAGASTAGAGIVLTGCDHTVALYSGLTFKGVYDPGVAFTDRFVQVQEIIDLRPQLRTFNVRAITRDGIPVHVVAFVPFRIGAGSRQPQLGGSFPFRKSAVFSVVHGQPVEHRREQRDAGVTEYRKQRKWDELVPMVATRLLQDIISEYTFDDLCALYQPEWDPRDEIKQKWLGRLRIHMKTWGIQILGGGIANLLPSDPSVLSERVASWRAEQMRRMAARLGESEAAALQVVELARAQAQAEMIRGISQAFEQLGVDDREVTTEVILIRFVEALEGMITRGSMHEALPRHAAELLATVRSGELARLEAHTVHPREPEQA